MPSINPLQLKQLLNDMSVPNDEISNIMASLNEADDVNMTTVQWVDAMEMLKACNIPFADVLTLYQKQFDENAINEITSDILRFGEDFKNHALIWLALSNVGVDFSNGSEILEALENGEYIQNASVVLDTIEALGLHGLTYPAHQKIYIQAIQRASETNTMPALIALLSKVGVSATTHSQLYINAINAFASVENIELMFAKLKAANITLNNSQGIFSIAVLSAKSVHLMPSVLQLLKEFGFDPVENVEIYESAIESLLFKQTPEDMRVALNELRYCSVENKKENTGLFCAALSSANQAGNFVEVFSFFKKELLTLRDHNEVYQAGIKNAFFLANIKLFFKILQNHGMSAAARPALFCAAIEGAKHPQNMSKILKKMSDMQISVRLYPQVYAAAFTQAAWVEEIDKIISALNDAGLSMKIHASLYVSAIEHASQCSMVLDCLQLLKDQNIDVNQNGDFYALSFQKPLMMYFVLKRLSNMNFEFQQNMELYSHFVHYTNGLDERSETWEWILDRSFDVLGDLGKAGYDIKMYSISELNALLNINESMLQFTFAELKKFGITVSARKPVYDTLLSELSNPDLSHVSYVVLLQGICSAARENPEISNNKLLQLLEEKQNERQNIESGPIEKNDSTNQIKKILEALCIDPNLASGFRFAAPSDYLLEFSDGNVINVSLLFQNANLSHLVLSDELVSNLDKIITQFMPKTTLSYTDNNPIVNLLPPIQRIVLGIYFTNQYRNINKMCRGEAMEVAAPMLREDDPAINMALSFVFNCLINDAINKIPHLVDNDPQKKMLRQYWLAYENETKLSVDRNDLFQTQGNYLEFLDKLSKAVIIPDADLKSLRGNYDRLRLLYPNNKKLVRHETLSPEAIRFRLGLTKLPATTSTSAYKGGSDDIQKPGMVETTFDGLGEGYIVNDYEKEVLLPQGTQVMTVMKQPKELISIIYCSPMFEKEDAFHSDTALHYAYSEYLSKNYSLCDASKHIHGERVARPNHGLPHTERVRAYLKPVKRYFELYAKDAGFKIFCENLTHRDLEWLSIAAAFSVTGRQNEESAGENIEQYNEFRAASAAHFKDYMQKAHPEAPHELVLCMTDVVRYMGNPQFETILATPEFSHLTQSQKNIRRYYHRLLTISHKLDLVRCYEALAYRESVVKPCQQYVNESMMQATSLKELIRYAVSLNQAHGNCIKTELRPDGELQNVNKPYQVQFPEMSRSWKPLFAATRSVNPPHMQDDNREGESVSKRARTMPVY